jgi:uncharacterized protein
MEFEWDEAKAAGNLEKHRISFEDAIGIFQGPVLEIRSEREGDELCKAIGAVEGREIAVLGRHVRSWARADRFPA